MVRNPAKVSRLAEGPVTTFPHLGEHTDPLLGEGLGLSEQDLATRLTHGSIR